MEDEKLLKKARNRALRYLTYRSRTVKELQDYLAKKNTPAVAADQVIGEMKEYGYLDDGRFAEDYIKYRQMRGYGKIRISYELSLKGLSRNLIEEKLQECYDFEAEKDLINKLVSGRTSPDQSIDERWLARQAGFLKRRGFSDTLIIDILSAYKVSD